ncbi:hypothetical protein [Pseudobacillus badius]|uniref:hypothetical protein n=1 Tax=Bacillus badius TaxID=1455 RepID=UPI0005978467|nr:hypothetical protein [Bacillus badius]KIL73873.1 hypothetical protein SD78_2931 [Bacillus badius]MED0668079.1 hypothetical protein [Bacillus badius]UAT32939.1 hypothetical protein K7T73_20060 [Bacillus badius]
METLLENHFIRVENLLKFHMDQQSIEKKSYLSEGYSELRTDLDQLCDSFTQNIKAVLISAKEKWNNNMNKVRDRVDSVKRQAEMKIKESVLHLNGQIKSFTNMIDEKNKKVKNFTRMIDEKVTVNSKNEKAPVNPYEEALLIQEKYGVTSKTEQWKNKKFLQQLHQADPEAHDRFLLLKELHLAQLMNEWKKPQKLEGKISKESVLER